MVLLKTLTAGSSQSSVQLALGIVPHHHPLRGSPFAARGPDWWTSFGVWLLHASLFPAPLSLGCHCPGGIQASSLCPPVSEGSHAHTHCFRVDLLVPIALISTQATHWHPVPHHLLCPLQAVLPRPSPSGASPSAQSLGNHLVGGDLRTGTWPQTWHQG